MRSWKKIGTWLRVWSEYVRGGQLIGGGAAEEIEGGERRREGIGQPHLKALVRYRQGKKAWDCVSS
jgi:hypothetical protein